MSRRSSAYLILLLTFLIWSNSFLAARLLVGEQVPAGERLDPLAFVIARFLPVFLVTWPWLLLSRERRGEMVRLLREHGGVLALLALLSVWAYNLPFAFGQHLVPPGAAALIITLNPVLIFVLAVVMRQERFALVRAVGLGLAFAGVWQVVVHGAGKEVRGAYVLDALVLTLSPLSWALYTVLFKRLLGSLRRPEAASPLLLTYLSLAIGSAPTLPLVFAHRSLRDAAMQWAPERWVAALFLGIGCTLLGYTLWNVALRRLPATNVGAFVFLNPPLALLFEWLWFGTVPSAGLLLGGALVLLGVYLCISDSRRPAAVTAELAAPDAPPVVE